MGGPGVYLSPEFTRSNGTLYLTRCKQQPNVICMCMCMSMNLCKSYYDYHNFDWLSVRTKLKHMTNQGTNKQKYM